MPCTRPFDDARVRRGSALLSPQTQVWGKSLLHSTATAVAPGGRTRRPGRRDRLRAGTKKMRHSAAGTVAYPKCPKGHDHRAPQTECSLVTAIDFAVADLPWPIRCKSSAGRARDARFDGAAPRIIRGYPPSGGAHLRVLTLTSRRGAHRGTLVALGEVRWLVQIFFPPRRTMLLRRSRRVHTGTPEEPKGVRVRLARGEPSGDGGDRTDASPWHEGGRT